MSTMSTDASSRQERAIQLYQDCVQCRSYVNKEADRVEGSERIKFTASLIGWIIDNHALHETDDSIGVDEVVDAELVEPGQGLRSESTDLAVYGDSLKESLLKGWFTEDGCIQYTEEAIRPYFLGQLMAGPAPDADEISTLGLKLTLAEQLGANWQQARVVSTIPSRTVTLRRDDIVDEVFAEPLEFWIHHRMPSGRQVVLATEIALCREVGHKRFGIDVYVTSVTVFGSNGKSIMGPTPYNVQEGIHLQVDSRNGSCEAYFTEERRRSPNPVVAS